MEKEKKSATPYMCHLCSQDCENENKLILHTKVTHHRILRKVIIKKRQRPWLNVTPQTQTPDPVPRIDRVESKSCQFPIKVLSVTSTKIKEKMSAMIDSDIPSDQILPNLSPNPIHDTDSLIIEPVKSDEEIVSGELSQNNDDSITVEKVEARQDSVESYSDNMDFYNESPTHPPPKSEPGSSCGVVKEKENKNRAVSQIQIKIVENPKRRKQRIESRKIMDDAELEAYERRRKKEAELMGAYQKRVNCTLSSALALKAARMKTMFAKKLAEQKKTGIFKWRQAGMKPDLNRFGDKSHKRFIYAQGHSSSKYFVPSIPRKIPLKCDPLEIFEDSNSPPSSPPSTPPPKEETDSQTSSPASSCAKKRPGTPWKMQLEPKVPRLKGPVVGPIICKLPENATVVQRVVQRGRPRKNKLEVEVDPEEEPESESMPELEEEEPIVENLLKEKPKNDPEFSRSGRRRVRSTKYQDFCDPSNLEDE